MFPFGLYPFNLLPQFNPWWPLQAQKMEELAPPLIKTYMQSYAAWAEMMTKGNPWLSAYNKMVEDGPFALPSPKSKK